MNLLNARHFPLMLPERWLGLALAFTTIASASFSSNALQGEEPEERLYLNCFSLFRTIDLKSGAVVKEVLYAPLYNNQGLAYDNGHLLVYNQNIELARDYLVRLNPASGRSELVGPTGFSLGYVGAGPARDPTTGVLYKLFGDWLFRIEPESGRMSFIDRLSPLWYAPQNLAFDSKGRLFALADPSPVFGWFRAKLVEIDPTTAKVTEVGDLPFDFGWFDASAFDRQGRFWFVHTAGGIGGTRLYRADIDTLEVVQQFPERVFSVCVGMAFGPAPKVATYCQPSTASTGCVPTIGWEGLPSASAHQGMEITCYNVRNFSAGCLLVGTAGRSTQPFAGGTLCVAPPFRVTSLSAGRGSQPPLADCSGSWSVDLNSFLYNEYEVQTGTTVRVQWFGRDPDQPLIAQHSAALEIEYLP